MSVIFMTAGWASACAETINGWPPPDVEEAKLQDFWNWINMVRPAVTGRLVLSVRDLPPDVGEGDSLVLDFEQGMVTSATIVNRAEVEDSAVFLLAGSYADWVAMLEGYDVGKMIMYRKLMLEKGETLQFFMAAFFWTELLSALQRASAGNLEPA